MKEIRDIIQSYHQHTKEGKRCALATVVHVEGSSYRRPGARMLICEDGRLTGAISGGCLEGDAMRKALNVINQQVPSLVTYDTMDDDDAVIGIGLGCNGIINVLIEPIDDEHKWHPIALLESLTQQRQCAVLITMFSSRNKKQSNAGTRLAMFDLDDWVGDDNFLYLAPAFGNDAGQAYKTHKNIWTECLIQGELMSVFLEFVPPVLSLVILGAGNDVMPLVSIADVLGWDTTVIDGRPSYAKKERFAKACDVLIAKPEEVIRHVIIDEFTFFALMTHNYNYDKTMLHILCKQGAKYIAMIGPKKKLERMLQEYQDEGRPLNDEEVSCIYGPAGLDIGAETAEEIALSILAEIKAVMTYKSGGHLKNKRSGIHE